MSIRGTVGIMIASELTTERNGGSMEENRIIPVSKHDIVNKKRRELAAKCIEDPYDMDSLEALFKLVHPLAAFVMNKYKRRIPSMGIEDYMQLADIVVWHVLNRIRVVPDIMNSFEAYLVASIRNCYITEYRKYVFKSLVEGRSFDRPGDTFSVATLYSMEEYVNRIIDKRNATRRAFRQNNLELVRCILRSSAAADAELNGSGAVAAAAVMRC